MGLGRRDALKALASALFAGPLEAARRKKAPKATAPIYTVRDVDLSPLPPRMAVSPLLDATPSDGTLEHRIYATDAAGAPRPITMRERIPGIEDRIALEQYAIASAHSDTIIFTQGTKPVAAYRLPHGSTERRAWEDAPEAKKFHITVGVARSLAKSVERKLGIDAVGFRVGYADIVLEGVKRYAPFEPYMRQISVAMGLPERMGHDAFQESNAKALARSKAHCEGMFQLGRFEARSHGLIVPKGKTGGVRFTKQGPVYTEVNESLHPLLAVEAAFLLMREYGQVLGGLQPGISGYHTGPGNLFAMRSVVKDIRRAPELLQSPKAFADQSLMINDGWRSPGNNSGYKWESANYVPRLLALMACVKPELARATPFEADRITILYAKPGKQLTGRDVARAFASEEEFHAYNMHIPLGAAIPSSTRVFLPRNTAGRFFAQRPQLLPNDPIIYAGGRITPAPDYGAPTAADVRYSGISLRRQQGEYTGVTRAELEEVRDHMLEVAASQPTVMRKSQLRATLMELDMLGTRQYQRLAGNERALYAKNTPKPAQRGQNHARNKSR